MINFLSRNIHWVGYFFGMFFGFAAGANYGGVGFSWGIAALHTLITMLILLAIVWILCGPPIFKRNRKPDEI